MFGDEDFNEDDFYDEEEVDENAPRADEKLRYKLYCPTSLYSTSDEGFGKFNENDYQGNYASKEMAIYAGCFKQWYQVVDKYKNEVIAEYNKADEPWNWEDEY